MPALQGFKRKQERAGKTVDNTHKIIKCLSADAAIQGKLLAAIIGSAA